jgi:hypothetical protein
MSVSAHLTPEPERRLWLILESMRAAVESADWRVAGLTAFAALELAMVKFAFPGARFASVALAAALPVGIVAFAPLTRLPKWLAFLDPSHDRVRSDDSFIVAEDLIKYSHGELIFKLDKYLGGGITATPYYEDVVGEILSNAKTAVRKRRLLRAACALVGAAQLALLF